MTTYYNGSIKFFKPDDTETEFYMPYFGCGYSFQEIMQKAEKHWPGCKMDELEIHLEYIHTDCLGYDQYDPSDYTQYLRITRS